MGTKVNEKEAKETETMSHDEIIAVIQAHKEGKKIEMQYHGSSPEDWVCAGLTTSTFNFTQLKYRIKCEPREWWFVKNVGVENARYAWTRHDTFQEGVGYLEQVHVREVIE